jgi:cell shape-determining protein MreC
MRWPNKRQTFWLLMAASVLTTALASRLPVLKEGPLNGLVGTALAPLTAWLSDGSQWVRSQAGRWAGDSPGSADNRRLQSELELAEQDVIRLRKDNDLLRTEWKEATQLRDGLRLRGRLIPAMRLGRDAVNWRESILVDIGKINDAMVRSHWAMAGVRAFVDRGKDIDVTTGDWAAGLADNPPRGVLIGQVEQIGQVTSRIKLLTDWDSRLPAEICPKDADRGVASCTIRGYGPGKLVAEDIAPPISRGGERTSDKPLISPGDRVVTSSQSANLPGMLFIGTVVEYNEARHTAVVRPPEYDDLKRVYLFDPIEPALPAPPAQSSSPATGGH